MIFFVFIFIFFIIPVLISVGLFLYAYIKEKNTQIVTSSFSKEYEERKKSREKFIQDKITEFNEELNSMPEEKIEIKPYKKTNKRLLANMDEYNYCNIRKNTSYSNFEKYIVLDTETTGLNARNNELLEISMIKFDKHEPVSYMTTLLKPNKSIPREITYINGIDDELVKDSPKVSQVLDSFNEFIKGYNIVGYNLNFDMKFLYVNGIDFFSENRKFYDVLDFARKKIKKSEIDNYKLDSVAENFDIYRNDSHRALSDAYATGLIFERLLDETIDTEVLKKYYHIDEKIDKKDTIVSEDEESEEIPWELQEDEDLEGTNK